MKEYQENKKPFEYPKLNLESKPKNIESKLEFKNEEDKLKYEIYEFFLNAEITGSNIISKDEIKKKLLRLKELQKDK